MNRKTPLTLILLCLVAITLFGQSNRTRITEMLDSLGRRPEYRAVAPFRLTRLNAEGGIYRVYVSENFKSVPFRPVLVDSLERLVGTIIASSYPGYRVEIYADKENIRDLIPNFYRLPTQRDPSRMAISTPAPQPLRPRAFPAARPARPGKSRFPGRKVLQYPAKTDTIK